jgi:hypothetical protein
MKKRFGLWIVLALVALSTISFSTESFAQSRTCTLESSNPTAIVPADVCIPINGGVLGPAAARPETTAGVYWASNFFSSAKHPIDAWGTCRFLDFTATCYRTVGGQTIVENPGSTIKSFGPVAPGAATHRDIPGHKADNPPSCPIFFVPYRTQAEWFAFLQNPPTGIASSPCARFGDYPIGTTDPDSGNIQPPQQVFAPAPYGRVGAVCDAASLVTRTFNHTKQACNSLNQCNTCNWIERFEVQSCTAVPNGNTSPTNDGGTWQFQVSHTFENKPTSCDAPPENNACTINGQTVQSGSTVYVTTQTDVQGTMVEDCPIGPDRFEIYDLQTERLCTNGTVTDTGNTRRINIRIIPAACQQPQACTINGQSVPSGQTATVTTQTAVRGTLVEDCPVG